MRTDAKGGVPSSPVELMLGVSKPAVRPDNSFRISIDPAPVTACTKWADRLYEIEAQKVFLGLPLAYQPTGNRDEIEQVAASLTDFALAAIDSVEPRFNQQLPLDKFRMQVRNAGDRTFALISLASKEPFFFFGSVTPVEAEQIGLLLWWLAGNSAGKYQSHMDKIVQYLSGMVDGAKQPVKSTSRT